MTTLIETTRVSATADALRRIADFIERHEIDGEDMVAATVSSCRWEPCEATLQLEPVAFLRLAAGSEIRTNAHEKYGTHLVSHLPDGLRLVTIVERAAK